MSTPSPIAVNVNLQSAQAVNTTVENISCGPAEGCVGGGFKDILANENLLSEMLSELKEVLPEDLFSKIEEMVESGNGLPLAAIFSMQSPLVDQNIINVPGLMQEAIKLDGRSVSPIAASILKLGEGMVKYGSEGSLATLESQISEAVSAISSKNDSLGKGLQDLLAAAKANLTTTEIVPKTLVAPTIGSDGAVTATSNINSALSGLAQLTHFQASGGSPLPPAIAAPLGEEGWGQAMGERIMWMMGKGVQAASIRITPPHLGPIQVQLSVQNEQASVSILAQHGAVKEALEAAIPRLRDMMNESNLQLVNVDISHRESPDQGSRFALFSQDQREQMEQFMREHELTTAPEEELPRYYRSSGLLDDYA